MAENARVRLAHTGRRSRRSSIEMDGGLITLPTSGVLGSRPWSIPAAQIGVVNLRNLDDAAELLDQEPEAVTEAVTVPYLATSAHPGGPNIALLFRGPQRVPHLPRLGGTGVLSARESRSHRGLFLDGVGLRAEDPVEAVIAAIAEGAERKHTIPTCGSATTVPRSGNSKALAAVAVHERRSRVAAVTMIASVVLLLGMRWASSQTDSWWPLPFALVSVLLIFGVPIWMKRRERRLKAMLRSTGTVTDPPGLSDRPLGRGTRAWVSESRVVAAWRVRSSAVGHRSAFVFSVVVAFACPSARWTVTTSQPEAMRPEA